MCLDRERKDKYGRKSEAVLAESIVSCCPWMSSVERADGKRLSSVYLCERFYLSCSWQQHFSCWHLVSFIICFNTLLLYSEEHTCTSCHLKGALTHTLWVNSGCFDFICVSGCVIVVTSVGYLCFIFYVNLIQIEAGLHKQLHLVVWFLQVQRSQCDDSKFTIFFYRPQLEALHALLKLLHTYAPLMRRRCRTQLLSISIFIHLTLSPCFSSLIHFCFSHFSPPSLSRSRLQRDAELIICLALSFPLFHFISLTLISCTHIHS